MESFTFYFPSVSEGSIVIESIGRLATLCFLDVSRPLVRKNGLLFPSICLYQFLFSQGKVITFFLHTAMLFPNVVFMTFKFSNLKNGFVLLKYTISTTYHIFPILVPLLFTDLNLDKSIIMTINN